MITKHIRTLIICFILFGLTSSCEDKDRQTFGKVNLTFDYQETVEATDTSSEDTTENRTTHSEPSQDEFEREQGLIKDRERSEPSLEIDVILDENEDLIERSLELKQDYRYANISINNGAPVTIDLTTQTSYSKTIAIGQALVAVSLLNFDSLVLYNAVKNVQINEDVNTSVTFLPSDWIVANQEIEVTSDFNNTYTVGDNIPITWTNTHTARGVKIEMIQSTTANVVKVLENNFIGDSYTFDTSSEPPRNNVGIKVTSMLNDTMFSRCCFDIEPANEAPTVENISETINEDGTIVITLEGSDGDDDSLTFSVVTDVSNGSLNWLNGIQLRYTPNSNYNGSDTFTYKANDGIQDSDTATVTITITAVNDAPTTNDVSTTIDENRTARVADLTLDGNDVDEDNLTYSLSSNPSNGTASINGNILTYNANQDWNGVETFTYIANDGELDSNASTITITVTPVNDDPTTDTSVISISTDEDLYVDIDLAEYVTDIDGDDLTFEVVSEVQNGATAFISSNVIRYQPTIDYNGQDSFTWRASDGSAQTDEVTVNITINPQDELVFNYPEGNEIVKYGDQVAFDWNVHPFNDYEIILIETPYENADPIFDVTTTLSQIFSSNQSEFTWNFVYDSVGHLKNKSQGKLAKIKLKDMNSEMFFESEFFKLLPQWDTKINQNLDSSHSIENNSLIDIGFNWLEDTSSYAMAYAIFDKNNNFILGNFDEQILIDNPEGAQIGDIFTRVCTGTESCNNLNGDGFKIPISHLLFQNNETYYLKTYINDAQFKTYHHIETDTLNINDKLTSEIAFTQKPQNRDYAYYDRIPLNFSSNNVNAIQIYPLSGVDELGRGLQEYQSVVSGSSSVKTVNIDLNPSDFTNSFSDDFKQTKGIFILRNKDFLELANNQYNQFYNTNTQYYTGQILDDIGNEVFHPTHLVYPSDTLNVDLFDPYINISSPEESSIVNIGEKFTINYETYGMRDATIDFVIERDGNEVYRRNNLTNSSVYEFETLFLENVSEGGNPFLGESKEHEIWIYATNSTESSNSNPSYEHRIQDYKFTIDATQVNDPVVTFPNGGENLIIGNTYNVEWNFEGIADSLTLSLQRIGPGDIQYSTRVKNDGNHPLTIPNVATDFPYKVILESEFGSFRDFSDNEFNIVSAGSSNSFGGDVNYSLTTDLLEHEISVSNSGSIKDIDVNISFSGTHPDHIRYLEIYLVSPQQTRVLLAGGDQMPHQKRGGSFTTNSNSFNSTSFNQSASKNIYDGTAPFSGDHRPEESLSSFVGEDMEGDWRILIADGTGSGYQLDVSHLSIDINSENYVGYIYNELNSDVYSADSITGNGSLEIVANQTRTFLLKKGNNMSGVVNDLDVELYLYGTHPDHLRYLTITLTDAATNPPTRSAVLFSGDQVTGSSNSYEGNYQTMKKVRFDDEAPHDANADYITPLYVSMKPVEPLSVFDDVSLNSANLTVTNNASSSIWLLYGNSAINRSAYLVDVKPGSTTAPIANDVSVSTNEDTSVTIEFDASDTDSNDSIESIEVSSSPENGVLSNIDNTTGTVNYMPNVNFNGSDSFTYRAKDTQGNYSESATVSITVNSIDDNPIASNVSTATNEDTPVTFNLSAEEYDGDSYSFTVESNPSNGSVTINGSVATYTPNTDFYGEDTFTFKAVDDESRMNIATATITVTAVNDPPVSSNISASTNEDTEVDITLSSTDIEGDSVTYSIVSDVSNGTTSLTDSVVTYSPDANWNGTDTFTYKANDGTEDSNISTVTITVTSIADTEIYIHSDTNSNGDGSSSNPFNNFIDALNILEEDTSTGYGKIILKSGTYDSLLMTNGYHADGSRETDLHIISETGDYSDVIIEDWFFESVDKDLKIEGISLKGKTFTGTVTPIKITESGHSSDQADLILKNVFINNNTGTNSTGFAFILNSMGDIFIEDSIVSYNTIRSPNAATIASSGTTYIQDSRFGDINSPEQLVENRSVIENSIFVNAGKIAHDQTTAVNSVFYGNSSFIEVNCTNCVLFGSSWGTTFNDGGEIRNSIIVNSTLRSLNSSNSKWTNNYNVIYNSTGLSTANGSTIIDASSESDALEQIAFVRDISYSDVLNDWRLKRGSVAIDKGDPNDDYSNEPEPNGNRINAGAYGNTISAQVTNSAPVTTDVFASTNEDTSINITLGGSDDDNDTLSYSVVASNNGTISLNGAVATYTPNANWNGTDTFTYKANDGLGDSNTSTVTVTVNAIDDAPTTSDINVSTDEDNAVEIPLEGADVDGDNLTYSINTDNMAGTATLNGSTVLYTPDDNWNGTDTFTYKANDGTDDSNTSTVTITVNETTPSAQDGNHSIFLDKQVNQITLNASDPQDDELTYSITSQPSKGSISLQGNQVTYTPSGSSVGEDSFTFTASDQSSTSDPATVTLNLQAYGGTSIELQKDVSSGIFNSWIEVETSELLGSSEATAVFSISMWLKPFESNNSSYFSRYSSSDRFWSFNTNGSGFRFVAKYGGGAEAITPITNGGTNYGTNKWNHLLLTVNTNGGAKIYINGQNFSYGTNGIGMASAPGNDALRSIATSLIFGLQSSGNTNYQFLGKIDEVLIIRNVELSLQQAQDIYNNGYGLVDTAAYLGNSSNILGYWKFNEGNGSNIQDESPNNLSATLNGGAIWSSD